MAFCSWLLSPTILEVHPRGSVGPTLLHFCAGRCGGPGPFTGLDGETRHWPAAQGPGPPGQQASQAGGLPRKSRLEPRLVWSRRARHPPRHLRCVLEAALGPKGWGAGGRGTAAVSLTAGAPSYPGHRPCGHMCGGCACPWCLCVWWACDTCAGGPGKAEAAGPCLSTPHPTTAPGNPSVSPGKEGAGQTPPGVPRLPRPGPTETRAQGPSVSTPTGLQCPSGCPAGPNHAVSNPSNADRLGPKGPETSGPSLGYGLSPKWSQGLGPSLRPWTVTASTRPALSSRPCHHRQGPQRPG